MATKPSLFRAAILVCVVACIIALTAMVVSLVGQLRQLSTAQTDNMQWTISQVDTELANLSSTLAQKLLRGSDYSSDTVRIRADIALSRLAMLHAGRVGEVYAGNEEAENLLLPITAYYKLLADTLDRSPELEPDDLRAILALTEELRPTVRRMAVLGTELSGARTQARRQEFLDQVARTGWLTVAAVVFLASLLLLLDQLYRRAVDRDTKLRASTQELASTVAASLDAIVTADQDGRITGFNAAAEDVFGWSNQEVLGRSLQGTLFPERIRKANIALFLRSIEDGAAGLSVAGRTELKALRKSGTEFPCELNFTSIRDDDVPTRHIAYVRDISLRKIAETSLIEARDRAERADKAKSQFLTVMSHEMRTPLNGILGVLDLLKTTRLSKTQSRYTELATASSEILLQHVNEALDATRVETGSLFLSPQKFEVESLCAQLTASLAPLAQEKGLVLSYEIDETVLGTLWGDSARIRQILTNLIGNAIKFSDAGKIELIATAINAPKETQLSFMVKDSGRGIAPEHQERIFEDFVALSEGEGRQFRGDGLGLSISRRIARQMGGDLSVKSALGQGACFTLNLPVSRAASSQTKNTSNSHENATSHQARHVLIVEDNNINRHLLKDMLLRLGVKPCEASNGTEALQKLDMRPFDLVFMDISMPEMDGIEATRRLRAGGGPNAQTPVIGLTAHGKEEYLELSKDAGMTSFFTKPLRLAVLEEILLDAGSNAEPAKNTDGFEELRLVLGSDRLAATSEQLFDELEVFLNAVQTGHYKSDSKALNEEAHRIKGAAQLLGFESLANALEDLQNISISDGEAETDQMISAISAICDETRLNVEHRLRKAS